MNPINVPRTVAASFALPVRLRFLAFLLLLLTIRAFAGQATLAWDPSTSTGVAGYNVYYGQSSGNYPSKLTVPNQTSYVVTGLQDGQTYYFVVTARDSTGKESARSNEARFTVPTSTAAPVPAITATPSSGAAPLSVTFAASSTTGTATGYSWDFGDGSKSTEQNVSHTYSAPGSYTVTLTATGPGGSNTITRSNLITVGSSTAGTPTPTTPTTTCPCTIWPATTIPRNVTIADTAAVNLGVKFVASRNGYITGIRFYKGPNNTGTHVGTLWSRSGQKLAEATFTGETSSGWQQVNFANPVPVTANTVYVASYHTRVGRYAGDNNFFATTGITRGPLQALRNGASGGNGVYAYGWGVTFPTNSYLATNYWVDVVFK